MLIIDPEEERSILDQIFRRKRPDTVQIKDPGKPKPVIRDTINNPADTRKEKREQRRQVREAKNKNDND
jgi:hypothetical protein